MRPATFRSSQMKNIAAVATNPSRRKQPTKAMNTLVP
jgi:hypothetical protein